MKEHDTIKCSLNFGRTCPYPIKCWINASMKQRERNKYSGSNKPLGSYPKDRKFD